MFATPIGGPSRIAEPAVYEPRDANTWSYRASYARVFGYPPYDWWIDSQKALSSIANDVKMIEVDCGHGIAIERPDAVASAVQEMVGRIRIAYPSQNTEAASTEVD